MKTIRTQANLLESFVRDFNRTNNKEQQGQVIDKNIMWTVCRVEYEVFLKQIFVNMRISMEFH